MGKEDVTNIHRTRCLGLVQRAAVRSFRPKAVVLPGRPASGWPRRDFPTCSTEGPPTPPTGTAGTFNISHDSLGLFSPVITLGNEGIS